MEGSSWFVGPQTNMFTGIGFSKQKTSKTDSSTNMMGTVARPTAVYIDRDVLSSR